MASKWTPADLPSMAGRTVVITGATSGIGRAAAAELSRAGARVVMGVRDTSRGEEVAREMGGDVEVRRLDLTDLGSVREFASGWEGERSGDEASGRGRIDVLIDNAGVMAVPEGRTTDGFETQIGTNHLGHFALAGLLIGHVTDRVVTLASGAHRMGKIDLEDLNWERRTYRRWPAYGQSKLANLQFMFELQRRLAEAGSPVRSVAAHPGYASTELQSRTGNFLQNGLMAIGNRLIAQSGEQGAWPTLYAATADIPGGSYAGPDGRGEVRGHPTLVSASDAARDEDVARGLWELSERLTGVKFEIPSRAAA
jgi:NAD(P)-dependent dehydrogenase (short-subunit alcohol dehydrogenase family)